MTINEAVQHPPPQPDPRLAERAARWEAQGFTVSYGEWLAPHQWGNTDRVATATRRGSWGQLAAQILCIATPPVGWIIGIAWWGFLRLSQVDIVLREDGALCEREHRGLRTSEFVIVEEPAE